MKLVVRIPLPLLAVAALMAIGCAGGHHDKGGGKTSARDPVVLTLGNPDPAGRDAMDFTAAVGRLSDGALRVDDRFRAPTTADYDRAVLRDVRAGRVDLGKLGVRSLDTLGVGGLRALVAPLLIDGLDVERRVLQSPVPGRLLPALGRLGLVGIALLPGEIRHPFGVTKALCAPEDYHGAEIGIRASGVADSTFRALGARPRTYLPGAGALEGLDGVELDTGTLEAGHYDAPGTTVTVNVGLWPRIQVLVMQRRRFLALSARQRRVLQPPPVGAVLQLGAPRARTRAVGARDGRRPCAVDPIASPRRRAGHRHAHRRLARRDGVRALERRDVGDRRSRGRIVVERRGHRPNGEPQSRQRAG
jgi:TRAP-type C4-dicarboxylate transport system substrate-binding protein